MFIIMVQQTQAKVVGVSLINRQAFIPYFNVST